MHLGISLGGAVNNGRKEELALLRGPREEQKTERVN